MALNVNWEDIKLENELGRGAFGIVLKAFWKPKNQTVAIKLINNGDESEIVKEIAALLKVKHENILKILGETKSEYMRTAIVMEYAPQGSLYNFLHDEGKENRPYTFIAALNWMHQCAAGIAYLHGMKPKILHRDLKTANLLLFDNYETLKLCDLGRSREWISTMSKEFVGTPGYSAPELAFEDGKYSEKCDVYSFGIILWEVLSRKKPYYDVKNKTPLAIINLTVHKQKRPSLEDVIFTEQPSYHLKNLMRMAWDENPENRPTGKELQKILTNNSCLYDFIGFHIRQPKLKTLFDCFPGSKMLLYFDGFLVFGVLVLLIL